VLLDSWMSRASPASVVGSETAIFFWYLARSLLKSPQDDYHTQPSPRVQGRGQPTSREPQPRRVEVCASHTAVAQGATPVLHLTTANMITRLLAALALASASAKVFFEGEFRPSQRTPRTRCNA